MHPWSEYPFPKAVFWIVAPRSSILIPRLSYLDCRSPAAIVDIFENPVVCCTGDWMLVYAGVNEIKSWV